MNRRAATFIFIALAVFLARPVKAADSIAVSDFFREGTSARSLGMGGAFAGLADDVGTIYWNPAGLMSIKGPAFSTTRSSIGGDLDLNTQSMSFALPVVGHGVAGFSLVYTSLGDMILTGLDSHSRLIPIGTIGEDDTGFSMSYAWPWRENTDVGITFKGAKQKLGGNSVNGWGFDAGLVYKMESGMRLGLTVQNLGMHIGPDTVPVNFRVGLAGDIAGIRGLTVGASYDSDYLDRNIVGVGAEYKIAENLTARAGSYDGKFTAGLGVNYENFQLDYSMNNDDDLGDLSKLSLGYYLSEKKTPSESKAPASKPAKAESKPAPKEEKKVEKAEEPAPEPKAETSSRSRSRSKPASESASKPEPEPEKKAAPAEEQKKVEEPAPVPKESKKEPPAEKPAAQAPVVQPGQQTTQAVGAPKSTSRQVIPSLDDLLSGTVIDQPMYKVPQIGEGSYTIIGQ